MARDARFPIPSPPTPPRTTGRRECDVLDWLRVRGPGYLVDGRKRIPETPVMECAKVDIFAFEDKPHHNVAETRPRVGFGGSARRRRRRTRTAARARRRPRGRSCSSS